MIRTRNLVPDVYYNKSRDFQALGRVFEIAYNYVKTGTDLLRNSYEDVKMLDLFAKTIGFNSKHNYNTEDLLVLCSTFIKIIKNKGSMTSVKMAIKALLNAQHIENTEFHVIDVVDEDTGIKLYRLDIYIPKDLDDLILLEDLFDYILPAGYTYRFIVARFVGKTQTTTTIISGLTNPINIINNNMSQVAVTTDVEGGRDINIVIPTLETSPEQLGISYASVVFKSVE